MPFERDARVRPHTQYAARSHSYTHTLTRTRIDAPRAADWLLTDGLAGNGWTDGRRTEEGGPGAGRGRTGSEERGRERA